MLSFHILSDEGNRFQKRYKAGNQPSRFLYSFWCYIIVQEEFLATWGCNQLGTCDLSPARHSSKKDKKVCFCELFLFAFRHVRWLVIFRDDVSKVSQRYRYMVYILYINPMYPYALSYIYRAYPQRNFCLGLPQLDRGGWWRSFKTSVFIFILSECS